MAPTGRLSLATITLGAGQVGRDSISTVSI
jgi:hypothetical protein